MIEFLRYVLTHGGKWKPTGPQMVYSSVMCGDIQKCTEGSNYNNQQKMNFKKASRVGFDAFSGFAYGYHSDFLEKLLILSNDGEFRKAPVTI